MKKAIYMGVLDDWRGYAHLYRLTDWDGWSGRRKRQYVVVSGIDLHKTTGLPLSYFDGEYMERFETFVFKATRKGRMISGAEMEGSFRGCIDHERALNGLGYSSRA